LLLHLNGNLFFKLANMLQNKINYWWRHISAHFPTSFLLSRQQAPWAMTVISSMFSPTLETVLPNPHTQGVGGSQMA
jgi:hypothetical protein